LIIDLIIEIVLYLNAAYHQKHLNQFRDVENHLIKRMRTINQKVNSPEPSLVIDEKPVVTIKNQSGNTNKKEQRAMEKSQKMREKQNGKNNSN